MSVWDHFHAGMSSGLAGNEKLSRSEFDRVKAMSTDAPWVHALQERAESLSEAVMSPDRFRKTIEGEIAKTRALLKLPTLADPFKAYT